MVEHLKYLGVGMGAIVFFAIFVNLFRYDWFVVSFLIFAFFFVSWLVGWGICDMWSNP